jgi:hypothetical protein
MTNYVQKLDALCEAIITQDAQIAHPYILKSLDEHVSVDERLAVYTNGYAHRLTNAVLADYKALVYYYGETGLREQISAFIRDTPSQHWDLNLYPASFASFFKTRINDPFALSLAELEGAISEVFWLPDSEAYSADKFASLSQEQLAAEKFKPRFASRRLMFDCSADAYLQAFREDKPFEKIPPEQEFLCVVRHNNEVQRIKLEPAEYALIEALADDVTFEQAFKKVLSDSCHDPQILVAQLPTYFSRWISNGFFRA